MKLYTGMAPNGLRVEIYMKEKNIEMSTQVLDVLAGEARSPEFKKINPLGEIPALELKDGTILTESVAICRYLEDLYPENALFGETALQSAQIEMWNRRVEQRLLDTVSNYGVHNMEYFADKIKQMPEYAETQKAAFQENLKWIDETLSDGRDYISGTGFSIADITAMAAFMVSGFVEVEIPAEYKYANAWQDRLLSRQSWQALMT